MNIEFAGLLFFILAATLGWQFASRLRLLGSAESHNMPDSPAGRYRPMLRLLAEDDADFLAGNPAARKHFRAERRKLFRGYLRCLTKDYGKLLAGIRFHMVQSGVDRPDLAKALATNRLLFTLAICKVEYRLALHAAGVGKVDISGVVEAFDAMRAQVSAIAMPSVAAA